MNRAQSIPLLGPALRGLAWVENACTVLFAAGLVLLAGIQVFARLVLDTGFAWIEALAMLLLLWLTVAGAVLAAREHQHLGIDVLSRRLPPLARRLVQVATNGFAVAICVLLAVACWDLVQLERESPTESASLLPAWVRLLALPIGFGLMALHYLLHLALPTLPPPALPVPTLGEEDDDDAGTVPEAKP